MLVELIQRSLISDILRREVLELRRGSSINLDQKMNPTRPDRPNFTPCRNDSPLTLRPTTPHGLSRFRATTVDVEVCVVPHPSNENWTLDGADAWRDGEMRPDWVSLALEAFKHRNPCTTTSLKPVEPYIYTVYIYICMNTILYILSSTCKTCSLVWEDIPS